MKKSFPLTRRTFLGSSAAMGAAAALAPLGAAASPQKAFEGGGEPLAVTMWDFSWLTRRTPPEAEYADFDRVLDDLAERGYNCVRMDAFPHLVAAGPDGKVEESFTMLPQNPSFMWGNHNEVEIEPRKDIIIFMEKLKERGMRAGLSSWFQDDATGRVGMVYSPEDFARVWGETLEFIAEHDLLDIIEWVDLCNEFPFPQWAPGAVRYMREQAGERLPIFVGSYSPEQKRIFAKFMSDSIEPLRSRFPEFSYCFSFGEGNGRSFEGVDFSYFDVLEPHIWLTQNYSFALASGVWTPLFGVPKSTYSVRHSVSFYYNRFRDKWTAWLRDTLDGWIAISQKFKLPLYTTEAWGPINWEDLPARYKEKEWDWVKDICEIGVTMSADRGWTGICTSNFCGPQHDGMWEDVEWHRKVTRIIKG